MNKYLSRKIKFISLYAMIAVVFIHSYNYRDNFLTPTTSISEGKNYFAIFEYFFSNGLLRFAVPLFFAISGYLFFVNFISIKESYLYKLKRRCFSLLVPYLLWAFLSALMMYLFSFSNTLSKLDIVRYSTINNEKCLLTCFINPPAFQLWYLQQLILFTVISPMIYLLIKNTKGIVLVPFAIPWLMDLHFVINSQALFFFSLGAFLAIGHKEEYLIKKAKGLHCCICVFFWIVLSGIITLLAVIDVDFISENQLKSIRILFYKLNEIIGLCSVWLIFDPFFKHIHNKRIMVLGANYVFFIYALHEPLLHFAYQLGLMSSKTDLGHISLYICMPLSVIAICILAGISIKRISKPLYSLMTGGRNVLINHK